MATAVACAKRANVKTYLGLQITPAEPSCGVNARVNPRLHLKFPATVADQKEERASGVLPQEERLHRQHHFQLIQFTGWIAYLTWVLAWGAVHPARWVPALVPDEACLVLI